MISRKRRLEKSQLYLILDKKVLGRRNLSFIAALICRSRIDIIQYRNKISPKATVLREARLLSRVFSKTDKLFIINDYPDIAGIVRCDGVHLGRLDHSVSDARKILGPGKLIGVSASSVKEALQAQIEKADYIGIGPVFPTRTKYDAAPIGVRSLKSLKKQMKVPYFAIGGISEANIYRVINCGVSRVAIGNALLNARDIVSQAEYFLNRLHSL